MIQNTSLLDGPSPSSGFDLEEAAYEAADSQATRPLIQDLTHPDGPLSPANSELVEVVSKEAESEAGASLGSRVPPELFENILFYVNVDRNSQRSYNNLQRKSGTPSPNDTLTDLKQCSLVCLFWAHRCREHMFARKTLEIRSYEDAKIFRRYVVGGCPRLTPVHQLIHHIVVQQDYESRRSFIHLLYIPSIKDKLQSFSIIGPVPNGFNPAKLDTPHWGISPSMFVPSSFLRKIYLRHVQLPSFRHVTKYIRHFSCATYIEFVTITWDGQTPTYSLPHASNAIACQRRPRSLVIQAYGGCTNAVHLALTALMLNPNCPLHRLSEAERVWMIESMTLLWGYEKYPQVYIGFNVSEQATTMHMEPFYFIFEEALSTDRSVSAMRVVGMHAYIDDPDDFPSNFDALVHHAGTSPTIRALVLLFDSFDDLQESLKPFIEVLVLAAETIELVLAYEEEEEHRAVGVDLVTLEPNGRVYTWTDGQSEDYWGRQLSSQMLQRQLKKKRWMSVH